ncbi:dienelactone hydrolase family protein [Massilia sp. GCM10023247]|uniref:dienelactone hydrolase family protein n=1 Tax=Massilia sp. GCM10023247 TaxID=3252643 RepID=UPI003607F095
MRVFVLLFVSVLVALPAGASQPASRFAFPNPPGPFAVGFKAVHQYDHTRAYRTGVDPLSGKRYDGERARPVQTLVWYPASGPGKPLVYGDYLKLTGSEDDFSRTEAQAAKFADNVVRGNYFPVSGAEQGEAALRDPMRAQGDAGAAQGSFPVVLYAPSLSAPAAENADLCEYLASHGYIVVASPSMGTRSREMPIDLEGAETQAADIAFLVRYARSLPEADPGRLALVGYSWGGLANVLAAAKDPRIKALVDLDGSVRAYPDLIAAAKYVTPATIRLPMLFAGGRPPSMELLAKRGKPVSGFLNDVKHADLYKLTMYPMQHFAFSSTYLRFAPDTMFNQYPRADVNRAHGWVADYVLHFLDAYLKDDGAARTWLAATPASHGIPAYAATLEARPAEPGPASRSELAAELARRGFEHAHAAYEALRARDKTFTLPEAELNAWGYGLAAAGQPQQAVQIFRLATLVYPDSANAFDSLAEGYAEAGNKAAAIKHYRRSLELDPNNKNAQQRLELLGAGSTVRGR